MQPRLDFVDWVNLCNRAEFVVTDGGSNQEELSYLGIPTLLLREETERLEGLGENVVLSKLNREIIELFIENYNEYRTKAVIKEVYPSKTIVDYLINRELL
jgi:UDP-N-acetylglucosamine 2-epimerase (non-hydrolysing)